MDSRTAGDCESCAASMNPSLSLVQAPGRGGPMQGSMAVLLQDLYPVPPALTKNLLVMHADG